MAPGALGPRTLLLALVAGSSATLLLAGAVLPVHGAAVAAAVLAVLACAGVLVRRLRAELAASLDAVRRSRLDDLTGLPHRTVLRAAVAAALEPVPAGPAPGGEDWHEDEQELALVALLVIDLDAFKDVNDRFGHGAGDALLRATAQRIAGCVPATALLARLGGDEFAVLLRGDDAARARLVADQVAVAVAAPLEVDGRLQTAASVGVAFADVPGLPDPDAFDGAGGPFGARGASGGAAGAAGAAPGGAGGVEDPDARGDRHLDAAEELLRCAEAAMYAAKAAGGGVRLFDTAHDLARFEQLRLVDELRAALCEPAAPGDVDRSGTAQLVVHYQPQVEAGTGRLGGLEALVRWRHPRHGLVGPEIFVDLAEEQGLIDDLTEHVLRTALLDARAWHDDGHRVRVAVNVSSSCLTSPALLPMVDAALLESGVEPDLLVVEVTETTLMAEPQQALATARRLRDRGVQLSIDDYGTGYSSLSYLSDLPATELKLDRSFTRRVTSDPATAAIVASTVDLAHRLGLRLLVEGVEDAETLAALEAAGCDETQGFLHGRPQPAVVVSRWLALGGAPERAAGAVPAPATPAGLVGGLVGGLVAPV